VLIGGAAVAGVLGYAYWKNGTGGNGAAVDAPLEAAVDDYVSPLGNSGTNSTGDYAGNVDTDKIDTNAKWTQAAVESLESAGWERSTVLTALGKYLAFKGLTANEVTIVMAARAVQGEPPTGGPFPIKDALPTPTPTTPTNRNPRGYGWYQVKRGDNMSTVMRKYNITAANFRAWNGGDALRVGEWIKVRGSANPTVGYNGEK
jgi:hypothetical protein